MIAHFVHNLNTYSGAAMQAQLLAQNLAAKSLIFNISKKNSPFRSKSYSINGVTIIDLPSAILFRIAALLGHVLRKNITIFHFHGFLFFELIIGVMIRRKTIIKTTLVGDDDFATIKCYRLGWLKLFLIRHATINIALTNGIKKINGSLLDVRVILVPNGVIVPHRPPLLKDKENSFCVVGVVCRRKRTIESINYFAKTYSHIEDAILHIIGPNDAGSGIDEIDGSYVDECRELTVLLGINAKVIFHGNLAKSDLYSIFKKSKGMIFFSEREGLPNVVLEALALNCVPIINGINDVAADLLVDRKHGYIIESLDVRIDIADLERVILSNAPYIHAQTKFSIERIARIYDRIYRRLSNSLG